MSYPATPTLSVDDAHERSISLCDAVVATTLVGTEGGTPSTVTVTGAVDVPFTFVAVIRYTVVVAGVTMTDPVEVAD